MATLVLQTAGQAIGSALGGPIGAMAGRVAGALAGSLVDQALFAPPPRRIEGPRLADLQVMTSSEGAPIPHLWGRARLSGQVIWATNLHEVATTRSSSGSKGAPAAPASTVTEYSYYANFAVALAQGPVTRIGRVWADGKELDLSSYIWRLHTGTPDQAPDSLIVAKEGAGNAPAYRDTAYIVFEELPLKRFGNRIPQLSFEVFRAVGDVEASIKAVNLLPGSTEFGYDTDIVKRDAGWGTTEPENTHSTAGKTDWSVSLDQLGETCPEIDAVSLTVAWFGNDLRCGHCQLRPMVDSVGKSTTPHEWQVAGLTRSTAVPVSTVDGDPAYGGTPDDGSVLRAIADLKARGLEVMFHPFILMDIAEGNDLPDPHSGAAGQPLYPWRGRITCDPAPGEPATPDKTAAVTSQLASFIGTAAPADFSIASGAVVYSGPAEWSLRRMVLHYAHLCAIAGGVDTFLLASELKGLTPLRDSATNFAFVQAMVALANDVKSVLPGADISYGADWSEYFGYHPQDGSGDVFFHLDDFWASGDVGFVGIDNYMPLSDWRHESGHTDAAAGTGSVYELDYLKSNIEGGEGFDWYYATGSDRDQQSRTPITDGAHGKPWVFRYKDLKSWWSEPHHNRPGGVEDAGSTAWVPESKPFRFTEAGCPAVDLATNQPNVFVDAKSAESAVPHYSSGSRDDFIQRRYIEALTGYWDPASGNNPVSGVDGKSMVDAGRIHFWAWDARPFPAFPNRGDVWSDALNHGTGHWLNGRLGAAPLSALVEAVCQVHDAGETDASGLHAVVDGFVIERPGSAREALEPLAEAFSFDCIESGGTLRFQHRDGPVRASVSHQGLVEVGPEQPLFEMERAQFSDLAASVRLSFVDGALDYRTTSVEARRNIATGKRELTTNMPMVLASTVAAQRVQIMLQELWSARESGTFGLPPSLLALEPGDVLSLTDGTRDRPLRLESVGDARWRSVSCRAHEPSVYDLVAAPVRSGIAALPSIFGNPRVVVMELPVTDKSDVAIGPRIAAWARPWPGEVSVFRDVGDEDLTRVLALETPAVIGETVTPLPQGPLYRLDRSVRLEVSVPGAALQSISTDALLGGGNVAAVGTSDTGWEIIQFRNAELIGADTYSLSGLLRGQSGSEPEMLIERPAGSVFVVLDEAVAELPLTANDMGRQVSLRAGPAPLDLADAAYSDINFAVAGLARRPLAPVQLKARRVGQDVHFSWIRRTRTGGDSWELAEVPLAEETEQYEIVIRSGATPVRTLPSQTTTAVYSAADQQADFGLPLPVSFDVSIT